MCVAQCFDLMIRNLSGRWSSSLVANYKVVLFLLLGCAYLCQICAESVFVVSCLTNMWKTHCEAAILIFQITRIPDDGQIVKVV